MTDLSDIHMCVQLFDAHPPTHRNIQQEIQSSDFSMAIFLRSTLWDVGDTITISFLPMDVGARPDWYSLSQVERSLTEAQLSIEQRARAAPSLPAAVKLVVQEMVQPAVPKLHLKFVESDGMLRVRFMKGGGSSSLIGKGCFSEKDQTKHTITFGWMDVGTIIHEFSHALGMLHEHQNPSGGIQWNREAVYEWAAQTQGWDRETTDFNILNAYAANSITGSVFDPYSAMLYFFPAELTLNGKGTRQNLRYSQTDLKWLASTYAGKFKPQLVNGGGGNGSNGGASSGSGGAIAGTTLWIIVGAALLVAIVLYFVLRA